MNNEHFWEKGGSAQPYVQIRETLNRRLRVPDSKAQRAIADFLDRETAQIDSLVEKQKSLIETLRERRDALIRRWMRAHETHMDVDIQQAASGSPSEEWHHLRVKHLAVFVAGGTPDTDNPEFWSDDPHLGTPWVSIGDMSRRTSVGSVSKCVTPAGIASKGLRPGPSGAVLFAMYASVGEVAKLDFQATWNQAILGIYPEPELASRDFLYYALKAAHPYLKRHFRSNTQNNMNAHQVANLPVLLPSLSEQNRIVALLDAETAKIDALIAKAEEFVELAQERRSAVITAAVTGQLPVEGVGV